jgi:predicted nucleic acid-binding protein
VRLYLDANAIIYAIEGSQPFRAAAVTGIRQARNAPEGRLFTSRLSRVECRSKPAGAGARDVLLRYDRFFQFTTMADITEEIIERATDLRARFRVRTPDAIHLATAVRERADAFLTGDGKLARCTDVKVILIA